MIGEKMQKTENRIEKQKLAPKSPAPEKLLGVRKETNGGRQTRVSTNR
jgi:hypothetical protein